MIESAMKATETKVNQESRFTPEMLQAAEKAQAYDLQALYDRWSTMSPVEIIAECREVGTRI